MALCKGSRWLCNTGEGIAVTLGMDCFGADMEEDEAAAGNLSELSVLRGQRTSRLLSVHHGKSRKDAAW